MLRSRIRTILHDPAWWVFIASFTILLWAVTAQDIQSAGGLYTLSELEKLSEQPGALSYFNATLFHTDYATLEELFAEYIPEYLKMTALNALPEVANNSNALVFIAFFPMFFVTRRIFGTDAELPLRAGFTRATIFRYCLIELIVVIYLVVDLVALLVLFPFTDGLTLIAPGQLLRLLLLRPLLFVAWCMPMVFASFLLQNMILSSLASFGILILQTVLVFKAPQALPFIEFFDRSYWTVSTSIDAVMRCLFWCLLPVILWLPPAYVVFQRKELRRE